MNTAPTVVAKINAPKPSTGVKVTPYTDSLTCQKCDVLRPVTKYTRATVSWLRSYSQGR